MENLPTKILSLLEELFHRWRVRAFVYVGISCLVTFALMGVTCLFTYMRLDHDYEAKKNAYEMKIEKLRDRLLQDTYEQAARATRLEGEIEGYRYIISTLSRKGKRRPLGVFTVTAYDPIESCKPFDDGFTSMAFPAGMGVAAVDPGVIPYGSVLYLPDLEKYFLACDTGSAMTKGDGRNIDILMPTVEEALEFGRKYLRVELVDFSAD